MSEWWEKYVGKVPNAGIFYPEEDWLQLRSVNGFKLHSYRFHIPIPRGLIFLFHGMFSESNDCSHVAKRFFEEGYAVIAIDQEGHGKSGGPRGNIKSLKNYAHDSERFILLSRSFYPEGTPVFIMGESMGGAICFLISLLLPETIAGMLLLAPALGVSPDVEPTLQKIARCLDLCCGCVRLKEFDQEQATTNKDFIRYFKENPYSFSGKMNVRTAVAMMDGLGEIEARLGEVSVPVVAFQGDADKVVSAPLTKKLIEICKSTDKEILVYETMYHDIFHEPEIYDVMEKAVLWVNNRTQDNRISNEML